MSPRVAVDSRETVADGDLTFSISPNLVEDLAGRVAERLADRFAADPAAATSPWLNVQSAADYLDWPRERLYKLTASSEIPHYKHDGRILFRRDELDSWLADYQQGPPAHGHAHLRRAV